jgi:general nucleoside transport system permease protein
MHKKKRVSKQAVIMMMLKFSPIIGAIAGLLIAAIFLMLWNINPGEFFVQLIKGAIGSKNAIGSTLNRATPYMIVGAATAIAYKAGAQNMGQEGQVFIGGLGAAIIAILFPKLPAPFALPIALLAAMLFGGLFAAIAVLFRMIKGVNEVLSTLILNYIGTLIVSAAVIGPLKSSGSASYPHTDDFSPQYLLFQWKNIGYLHSGIFIAVILVIFLCYYLWVHPSGLKIRMTGSSPLACRTAGGNPIKIFAGSMIMCGALSGLAGGIEIFGKYTNLRSGYATGIGWDALIVALLAGLNPTGVIPASIFFGALYTGINTMQRTLGVPSALLDLIKGCIMLFIVFGAAMQHRIKVKPQITTIRPAQNNTQEQEVQV